MKGKANQNKSRLGKVKPGLARKAWARIGKAKQG
jgi:hypothetical protein